MSDMRFSDRIIFEYGMNIHSLNTETDLNCLCKYISCFTANKIYLHYKDESINMLKYYIEVMDFVGRKLCNRNVQYRENTVFLMLQDVVRMVTTRIKALYVRKLSSYYVI